MTTSGTVIEFYDTVQYKHSLPDCGLDQLPVSNI